MPQLVLTNTLGADVYVSNLSGRGTSFKVPPGGLTVNLSGTALEFIGPQLDALTTKGWLTYTVGNDPNRSDDLEVLVDNSHASLQPAVVPAAKGATAIHAAVFGDAVGPVTVNTVLTNPDVPRNLQVAMGATYDGGDVTVNGTNQFDAVTSEVFTAGAGATRVGNKVFKTVTSFTYAGNGVGAHGTNTLSVGTGDKIGVAANVTNATAVLYMDGAVSTVTIDAANDSFLPGTVANNAHSYVLLCNILP